MVGGNGVSAVNANLVDVESNLMGIDRPTTKCAKYRYIPNPKYIRGKRQWKTNCYPKIGMSKLDLHPCQMFDLPEVPCEPEFVPRGCDEY